MTDFRMRLIIETILKDEQLLKKLKKDLEGVGTSAKEGSKGLKGFVDKIGAMKGQILAAAAVLVAFGVAVKKTFDFAREGAAIKQMGESFDLFLEQAGVVPDLLNDLKFAAKGTITDFNLMSSTMTLVMGATGGLKEELLKATPQLLEMAKAANKLNPALGSVEFLYESLARGIKRASPLILDNLGVIIKVGEAYQTFADKMGISIKAMSATEKTQAVLHAALLAGDALIDQVGGTTDALTDSYDRLTANIINAKNAFLTMIHEGVEPLIGALDIIFFGNMTVMEGIEKLEKELIDGTISWEEYHSILTDVVALSKKSIFINDLQILSTADMTERSKEMGAEFWKSRGIIIELTKAQTAELEIEQRVERQLQAQADAAKEASVQMELLDEALEVSNANDVISTFDRLATTIINAEIAFRNAREEFSNDPFSGLDTSLASAISTSRANKAFADAGGTAMQAFLEEMNKALFDNKITEAQWDELLGTSFVTTKQIEIDAGATDIPAAAQAIATEFGISLDEAFGMLEEVLPMSQLEDDLNTAETLTRAAVSTIETLYGGSNEVIAAELAELFDGFATTAMDVRKTIQTEFGLADQELRNLGESFDNMTIRAGFTQAQIIKIKDELRKLNGTTVTVTIKTIGSIPKGDAHGATYNIPAGFPNDSYFLPLNVQSGEVVTVTPEGRTPPRTEGRGGDEITINAPIYINSESNQTLEQLVAAVIPKGNI